jgi:hypothetical protein
MTRSIIKTEDLAPPEELTQLFADPPLVGNEKREDYDRIFSGIVGAFKPSDSIIWIYVKDFVDLTWELIRERRIKAYIIGHFEKQAVGKALQTIGNGGRIQAFVDAEARQWATDPKLQAKHEKTLLANNFPRTEILAQAYIRGGHDIDAIDRRIASYELRRMAVLKTIENCSDKLARQVEAASSEVIDGEFTEAAE